MTATRSIQPHEPMNPRTRRWLITFCALMLAVFTVQLLLGAVGLWATFDSRDNSRDTRTVSCATLGRVAPDLFKTRPECQGLPLPTASPTP